MMKMNFHLAIAVRLKRRQHFEAPSFILFSWKKVCVTKRGTVMIANCFSGRRGQLVPGFKLSDSFRALNGLKVISHQKDQMLRTVAIRSAAYSFLQPPEGIANH